MLLCLTGASRVQELEGILIRELSWREEGYVKDNRLVPGVSVKQVLNHCL